VLKPLKGRRLKESAIIDLKFFPEVIVMKIYLTSGTSEFLKKLRDRHPSENMLLMGDDESSVLLHETQGKTVFSSPRKYEVLDSAGSFDKAGFIVMNNIPVTDEGRPVFEYRFKNRQGKIENQLGFAALRVLRPLSSNTYVILTAWEDRMVFERWKESESFQKAHQKPSGSTGANPQTIFSGASYITTYSIAEEE
jgi:heme-degrading monooxygenase HmoA